MKKSDEKVIQKILELCKYIKWKNVNSEKEYYKKEKNYGKK